MNNISHSLFLITSTIILLSLCNSEQYILLNAPITLTIILLSLDDREQYILFIILEYINNNITITK